MGDLLTYLVENDPNFRIGRLPALYSDFRPQRTLNPDGFDANVKAWKHGLSAAALAGRAPTSAKASNTGYSHFALELNDGLLRSLESKKFGRPLALGTALQHAVEKSDMIPLEEFKNTTASIYNRGSGGPGWGRTIATLPLNMVTWGLRSAGVLGSSSEAAEPIPKGQFVVLENLEAAAASFSDAIADRTTPFERIFTRADFQRTFADSILHNNKNQKLSEADLDILTKFLSRDKSLLATDGQTIKILDLSDPAETPTIAQEDSAIASLKSLTADLTRQTETLTTRIDTLTTEAHHHATKTKNRVAALAALRAKKQAEATLSQRHETLAQLEEVATKMQQASDNAALVRVMASSATALGTLNSRVGSADSVDAVLADLRDRVADSDEIAGMITQDTRDAVDEGEVDAEFEALLREEVEGKKKEEEEAEKEKADKERKQLEELEKLGSVPTGDPVSAPAREATPATETAMELEKMGLGGGGGGGDGDKQEEKDKEDPQAIPA